MAVARPKPNCTSVDARNLGEELDLYMKLIREDILEPEFEVSMDEVKGGYQEIYDLMEVLRTKAEALKKQCIKFDDYDPQYLPGH